MPEKIADLPFWQLTLDKDGDFDRAAADALVAEVGAAGITDLVMFSHGWNNSQDMARTLYTRFFQTMAPQLAQATHPVTVGLVGVFWPAQRWADEPIPDFAPAPGPGGAGGAGGAAGLTAARDTTVASDPTLDPQTLHDLKALFPDGAAQLDRMAELLATEPTQAAADAFLGQLKAFAAATAEGRDDGEAERADSGGTEPRMLKDDDTALFERYADALEDSGVEIDITSGGAAGLGDSLGKLWHGAKEALRGLTYWQMKNRAGVVGEKGLGPFVGRLHQALPQVKVHLVGHSFGARVVSFALAGLPDATPSPVRSVTLLQGAYSHYAFADPHPFDASRKGALAGRLARIDGPLTVCFSSFDGAVGTFYPLASMAQHEDSAAVIKPSVRWGGMGADGAQGVDATLESIGAAGSTYAFAAGKALNVDASSVVKNGGPPVGAHSDIVHPELTWIVLAAGGIVG